VDRWRYNLPTDDEVAAIVPDVEAKGFGDIVLAWRTAASAVYEWSTTTS